MSPVLEELALAVGQRVEGVHPIGAEARERRDVVGAGEHVHGVDLERMQPRGQLAEVPQGGGRRSGTESLRSYREAARLRQGELNSAA